MANPLRSEAAAFHWVLGTIAVAALVVAASWLIGPWAGLAVVVLLAAAGCWLLVSSARRRRPPAPPGRADVEDTPGPRQQ